VKKKTENQYAKVDIGLEAKEESVGIFWKS
jgi:hypothetical protein